MPELDNLSDRFSLRLQANKTTHTPAAILHIVQIAQFDPVVLFR